MVPTSTPFHVNTVEPSPAASMVHTSASPLASTVAPSSAMSMASAIALLSAGQPRIRFVIRDMWERLTTEAGQHPVAVTTDMLTILDGLSFRTIVRRRILATSSDDLDDKVKLTKLFRQAFEKAAVAGRLPTYIRDPF
jgi:hypothetical protein